MLGIMLAQSRVRACLATTTVVVLMAGCGAVPPLHRSVVVETNSAGVPVHASGKVADNRYTVVRGDTLYSIAFRANVDFHQLARWNGISAPYVIHPGQVLRLTRPADMPARAAQVPVFHTVTTDEKPSGEPAPVFQTVPSTPPATATVPPATTTSTTAATAAAAPAVAASTVVAVAGKTPVATPQAQAGTSGNEPAPDVPSGATREVSGIRWRWPAAGSVSSRFDPSAASPGIIITGDKGDPVRAAASGVVVYSGNGLVGYGELVIIKHNNDYLSAYGHNSQRLVKEGEHVEAGQMIARMGSTGAPRVELEFQVRYKGKPVDPLHYLPSR